MIRILRIGEKRVLVKALAKEKFSVVYSWIREGGYVSQGIIESPEILLDCGIILYTHSLEEAEDLVGFLVDTGISASIVGKALGISTDRQYFSVLDDISFPSLNCISVYPGNKEEAKNFLDLMKALSEREGYRTLYRLNAGQPDTLILK